MIPTGREWPQRVGLSRSLGSNAVDGLAGPRMASPGGFRSFVATAGNGEVAPIPATRLK
jgi:hypothetical protein